MMRTSILTGFLVVILQVTSFAQDPHFTQFYQSPLSLNPTLTGLFNGTARVTANYRNQWASVTVPYQTFAVSADGSFFHEQLGGDYVGGGLIIMNDVAGDAHYRSTQIAASAAYHKALDGEGTQVLSAGVQIGAVQRDLDFSKLFFDSQFDGTSLNSGIGSGENLARQSFWYFDIGAGVNWYYVPDEKTSFYAGAAVSHLNQPNQSFLGSANEQISRKLTVHAGAEFAINERIGLLPQVVFLAQGPARELNLGAMVRFKLGSVDVWDASNKALSVGLMHRIKDAVILNLRFDTGSFSFGASYDMNTSSLSKASKSFGGPEVSVMYRFGADESSNAHVRCPTF